jgi:hypothetical protein
LNSEIKTNLHLLEKAVQTKESRYSTRALHNLPTIRKNFSEELLGKAINQFLPKSKRGLMK